MYYCIKKGNTLVFTFILALQFLAFNRGMATTYTFNGDGNWDNAANWEGNNIPPSTLPSGDVIILTPFDYCVLTTDLVIEEGALLDYNIYRDFRVGDFNITVSGTFNIDGDINSDSGFDLTVTSTGVINLAAGVFVHGVFINEGSIIGNGGSLFVNSGENNGFLQINDFTQLSIDMGGIFSNGGTIEINGNGMVSNSGTFYNTGILEVNGQFSNGFHSPEGFLSNTGTIKGTGTMYTWNNFLNEPIGIIAPGNSPGTLTIDGDFTWTFGTYEVEINGPNPGEFDSLSVTGMIIFDGGSSLLNIVFGYTPNVGATFNIMTSSFIVGSIIESDNVTFRGGNVDAIQLSYPGGNTVRLTVIGLLPVELVSFGAKPQTNYVQLNWKTASEQDNRGFEIQRSADAHQWETLGFVAGNGTSSVPNAYDFMDKLPFQGMNYYRLRQVDFNEGEAYSPIRTVEWDKDANAVHIFPNPANGEATVTIDMDYSGEASITIYDAAGKQISNYPIFINKAQSRSSLPLSGLNPGTYSLEIKAGNKHMNKRLIVK